MTREEAIEVLTDMRRIRSNTITEACDMAISALSAETKKHQKEVGAVADGIVGYETIKKSAEQVTSKLKNPCDSLLTEDSEDSKEQKSKLEPSDLISRADVLGYINRLDTCGLGKGKALEYFRKYVEKADSVSAERVGKPLVRGSSNGLNGTMYLVCDQCESPIDTFDNYCRSCGARMENKE